MTMTTFTMTRLNESRRNVLKAASALGLAGLAGCLGDDGDDSDDTASPADDSDDSTDDSGPDLGPEDVELHPEDYDHWSDVYESDPDEIYGMPVRKTPPVEQTIDPDELTFSYAAVEDPAIQEAVFQTLIDRLEEFTGKSWEYVPIDSDAAMVEGMRAERLHCAGFATGSTPFAVNLAGAQPFGTMANADGTSDLAVWFIANADSDVYEMDDLVGANVAHGSEGSNTGNLLPRAILADHDITPEEDYGEFDYAGGHSQVIQGVGLGDYDAGPVASTVFERLIAQGQIDADDYRVIFESVTQPAAGYSTYFKLHPDLQESIRDALMDWNFEGTELGDHYENNNYVQIFGITYEDRFEIVRRTHEVNGITYGLDDL